MSNERYIVNYRHADRGNFMSDSAGNEVPSSVEEAIRVMGDVRLNCGEDIEFEVLCLSHDTGRFEDVTTDILASRELDAAEELLSAILDAAHIRQESRPDLFT